MACLVWIGERAVACWLIVCAIVLAAVVVGQAVI